MNYNHRSSRQLRLQPRKLHLLFNNLMHIRMIKANNNNDINGNDNGVVLWQALANKYQFNFPKDWYKTEAHWLGEIESFQEQPVDCPGKDPQMNNSITRISQCNESYQLCNSLPRSFIVPKDLKDFTLINNMSTVIKDHRVPVISYCCPIEYKRNFILRCASISQHGHVIDTLRKVVKPLKVLNLSSIAPTTKSVELSHKKLRSVCKPGDDVPNFISKSGKWLKIVAQTLKLVRETANTLLNEASVILIENNDKGWNSLMSSLVQIIIEPHRRTIEGLESLISKEWIYLSGGQLDYTKPDYNKPDIIFWLFLDCVYQIYLQNPTKFEFTSEYLAFLHKASHNYTNVKTSRSSIRRGANGYSSRSDMKLQEMQQNQTNELEGLEGGYKDFMYNPFYDPDSAHPSIIRVYDNILNIKLWSSLYLQTDSLLDELSSTQSSPSPPVISN